MIKLFLALPLIQIVFAENMEYQQRDNLVCRPGKDCICNSGQLIPSAKAPPSYVCLPPAIFACSPDCECCSDLDGHLEDKKCFES